MAMRPPALPGAVATGLRRQQAAQLGGYGSIAARFAPDQYGSIASRQYPGAFAQPTLGGQALADQQDDQRIQHNARILTLMGQKEQLDNPQLRQQLYQGQEQLSLRRQQQTLNPPNLGLDEEDENGLQY